MKKLFVAIGVAALSTGAMAQNVGGSIIYNSDNGHYYQRYINSSVYTDTWQAAQDFAISQGGYLCTITSKNEDDFVASNFRYFDAPSSGGKSFVGLLLGGTDVQTDGDWKWVTGEAWTYSNWDRNQPDSWGGQYILQYIGNNGNVHGNAGGVWDDFWGDSQSALAHFPEYGFAGFIVEYNSNPAATGNNAVPEPSEWAAMGLLGAGLLGLMVRGRKKTLAS